jgi:predicted AAA+ superfamily ATPase
MDWADPPFDLEDPDDQVRLSDAAFVLRRLSGLVALDELAPKVYLTDSGLLHSLLGIASEQDLLAHPKCGASWEGFALREVVLHTGAGRDQAFFWALHSGAELDLLVERQGQRLGFEIKLTRSPKVTPSMRSAQEALGLAHLYVVCHGDGRVTPLAEGISAVPLQTLGSLDLQCPR